MRDRAVAPVVGKALEAGVVALYLGLVTTALFAGAVPDYRTAAADEVAERTLATATQRVQQAVPPNESRVDVRTRVGLPDAIRGRSYAVRADGRSLVLDHPHPDVGARAPLALPGSVVDVSGQWRGHEPAVVVVRATPRGLAVRLRGGDAP